MNDTLDLQRTNSPNQSNRLEVIPGISGILPLLKLKLIYVEESEGRDQPLHTAM